jgi:GNAT superfamily N-acetyltransferase
MEASELELAVKPTLSGGELDDAQALVRAANWNQLPDDWRILLAHGRVYAMQTAQGRIVATTATLPYPRSTGAGFAWISMVLVTPAWRRRGLATLLMRRAVSDLLARDLVPVLDATPDGRAVYRALGFEDGWGFHRLARDGPATMAPSVPAPDGLVVRALADQDWPALCAYDAAAFGADRSGVLAGLRGRLPAAELVAERGSRIAGFLLGRDGRLAPQAGPLIAEDDAVAGALIARALAAVDGPLFVDLADAKLALRGLLEAAGLRAVRPLTRMAYRTSARFDDAARTYAVVGPEFG